MSMKKTDLYKNMAKKLGRDLKAEATPTRFAKGSTTAAAKAAALEAAAAEAAAPAAPKPVQVICRLPAPMVAQLREQALSQEGGISAVVAAAVEQYFASAAKPKKARAKKAD